MIQYLIDFSKNTGKNKVSSNYYLLIRQFMLSIFLHTVIIDIPWKRFDK